MLRSLSLPLASALLVAAVYVYLERTPALDPRLAAPLSHFYVVTLVSLLAAGLALIIGIAGVRLRSTQVLFLALAFLSLALMFALHGLATPDFLLPRTRLPGTAAQLSVLLFAAWFALSVAGPGSRLPGFFRNSGSAVLIAWGSALSALIVLLMVFPQAIAWLPVDRKPLQWGVMATVLTLLLFAGLRFLQAHRFSRLPLQHTMVYVAGWVAVAQIIMVFGELFYLSWWLYHYLLLAAVVLLGIGMWRQYAAGTLRQTLTALFAGDPLERLALGLAPSVKALVVATEAKDRYTAGHNYRVALYAVRLGKALGLPPEQLRALAQGGMVHDVGKLEVPDAVLNKPGALSEEERRLIENHPLAGHRMGAALGLMPAELQVIRHHHERWDGTGYPDGLAGSAIPRLARILAIADVYDALTSERSYRAAWSHEQARRHILGEAGKAFDPVCVRAWTTLTAEGPLPAASGQPEWKPLLPARGWDSASEPAGS